MGQTPNGTCSTQHAGQESMLAVFLDDDKGPLCKQFFDDLDEAKAYCQDLAQSTGIECCVYSFGTYTEITRSRPHVSP